MGFIALLPWLMEALPIIQQILTGATSNMAITTGVQQQLPQNVVAALPQIGLQLFPKVSPALQIVAAVLAVYSKPSDIKDLQTALNKLLKTPLNLTVDGVYGAKTRDAVEALQQQLGLIVDGVAGHATKAAIATELAKLPH